MIRVSFARSASAAAAVLFALTLTVTTVSAQAAPPAPPSVPPTAGAAAPATPAYLASHAEAMAVGRATILAALTGLVDSLVATADPLNGPAAEVRARATDGLAQISLQLGAERRVVAERVMMVEGKIEYWRTAEFERVPVPLVLRVTMGAKGNWRGVAVSTEEEAPAGEEVKP